MLNVDFYSTMMTWILNISFILYLLGSVCQGIDIIINNAAMNKALCA